MCLRVEPLRWRVALTAGWSTLAIVNGDARYQVASVATEVTHTNIWSTHSLVEGTLEGMQAQRLGSQCLRKRMRSRRTHMSKNIPATSRQYTPSRKHPSHYSFYFT